MSVLANKALAVERRQLKIALGVYLVYTLLLLLANVLNHVGEQQGTLETLEPIAGMLMGFIAIPIFAIALPLRLAQRWQLTFSFWPRRQNWLLGAVVIAVYTFLVNQQSLVEIAKLDISLADFATHFVSTMMFHITYYPLFAVLLLPVLRKNWGVGAALLATSVLFAVYHLAQFYYFPAGLTPRLQALLVASFMVNLLLYLWTENLILVALAHNVGGSVGLAVNDTLFNQVDELFLITLAIVAGLFVYMIVYEARHRERPYRAAWWLQTKIEEG